jgi:hypothetical protein
VPGDDIARFANFLGSFVQSKGMVVNLQKLPGASAQNCNFNSVTDLQKLVKFVENSENCKMNFVGFMVANTTTFIILTSSDSGYF